MMPVISTNANSTDIEMFNQKLERATWSGVS